MKLARWVLALHLVATGIASGVAMVCEADGTKLRALSLSFCMVGWATAVSALAFFVWALVKGRTGARELLMLAILFHIGFVEARRAMAGWEYLAALPG